ncbi:extracellular solute-binding protein, partial [Mesorhizobium sp. M00.F.Ca.ET.186.01.1.1]
CALALGLSGVLAGCGSTGKEQAASTGNTTKPATETAASNGPVEIDFWYALGGVRGKTIEDMVKKFNESHKDIKVKAAYQGAYQDNHSKVLASVAAGNNPDVTMVEIASIAAFA